MGNAGEAETCFEIIQKQDRYPFTLMKLSPHIYSVDTKGYMLIFRIKFQSLLSASMQFNKINENGLINSSNTLEVS